MMCLCADAVCRSIGDWHSTKAVDGTVADTAPLPSEAEERSGRWAGQVKTECGLHKDYFKVRLCPSLSWDVL